MVQLLDSDIKTREVLGWKGVHVLHFIGSSCSQKLRVFLNLKGIPWQSHHIDLHGNENYRPWFLGINPRGLLPVLVQMVRCTSKATISSRILKRHFRRRNLFRLDMRMKLQPCSSTRMICISICAR
jgi:hypothetical protein